MYKRKREQEDLMNHRHSGIKEEAHVEGDSNQAALAGGPMREPTTGGEGGSSASWQPRLYECQFCKRGFTSAQALGGHMNVHRRDRALGKAGFHGSVASNHRNTNNNNNNNHHVNILQPHGHMEKSRSSFYVGSASSFLLPYDQPSATTAAAASQPSLFVPHVATRTNREKYRPELCIQCSSKSTHIIDQPNFRVEWHKSAAAADDDDDGEVDLELRLGEKP